MTLTDWAPVILGGGGLFTVMSFVTKTLVDQKQETINRYSRQCQDLKEEIKAEREKAKDMLGSISELLREVEANKLDPANAALLGSAMRKAEEPLKNLEQEFADCEIAADWVDTCKMS